MAQTQFLCLCNGYILGKKETALDSTNTEYTAPMHQLLNI